MKRNLRDSIIIPEAISCEILAKSLKCSRAGASLSLQLPLPRIEVKIEGKEIILSSKKGNKNHWKIIKSYISHIKNLFAGLEKKYVGILEVCNVHFPMTLKAEHGILTISNFLGEKVPRRAVILPNVNIEIKGQKITLTSSSKEAIGQTAANIEIATKVRSRDRRVFQDGIFITQKPEAEK